MDPASGGYTRGRRTAEQAAGGLRGASGTETSRRKGEDGDGGQRVGDADRDAPEAPRNGRPGRRWTSRAVAPDRRDTDPPWPELLGTRTGRPDGRRPWR